MRSRRALWLTLLAVFVLPAAAAGQVRRAPRFEKAVGETAPLGWVNNPIGIAVSPADDGRVYVVDRGNARIQVFSPTGQPLGVWGSRGNGRHQFWQPSDIAVSPDGRFVYVVDQGHKRVQRFEPAADCFLPGGRDCFSANRVQFFGYGGELKDPTGLAVDRDGRVYVADTVLHKVVVYNADGKKVDSFGEPGSGRGELLHPSDVAVHPDGSIWVADSENDRISQFTRDGEFKGQWSGGGGKHRLYRPTGLDIDAHGDFVVRDYEKSVQLPQVAKYGVGGSEIWQHNVSDTQVDGEFAFQGVALLPDGTTLITDPRAPEFAILQVLPNGIAAPWGASRSRSPMQLEQPIAVALDSQLLGVVDAANHRAVVLRRDPERYYKFLGMMGPPFKPEFDLLEPTGIAIHRTGPELNDAEVYVVDREQHSVYIADPTGESLGRWGDGTPRSSIDGFKSPSGIAVAPNGDVYVADTGNNRIVRRSPGPKGTVINTIGTAGDKKGELEYPSSVTVGPGNFVFVLEVGKNRLQMFTPEGAYIDGWDSGSSRNVEPGDLWFPQALSTDGKYLYVLESDAPWDHVRVQVLDPRAGVPLADSIVTIFPEPGTGPGPGLEELWGPLGISAIAEGLIAIADAGNSRVVLYRWGDGSSAPTATPTEEPPTATVTVTQAPPTEPATATTAATATATSPTATATEVPPSPTGSAPPPTTPAPPTTTGVPSATTTARPTLTPTDPPSPITQPTPIYRQHIYLPLMVKNWRVSIRRR